MKNQKVILMKGLPGSGKSTRALDLLGRHPERYKRINRDSLREMQDGGKHSRGREKMIRRTELRLACFFLEEGYSVIVDDCNLSPSAQAMWRGLAEKQQIALEIIDLTDAPIETCIERDLARSRSVGERVIRQMHRQFIQPQPAPPDVDPTFPTAIVCDLDGTLALLNGRDPYNAATCSQDLLNAPVAGIVQLYAALGVTILFTSGREDRYREQTIYWLRDHGFDTVDSHCFLFMRDNGDNRRDAVVKREIYEREIRGKYNVLFALDDRNRIVELWRSLGLVCLQVADGDF